MGNSQNKPLMLREESKIEEGVSISQMPIDGATLYVFKMECTIDPRENRLPSFNMGVRINGQQVKCVECSPEKKHVDKHTYAFWANTELEFIDIRVEYCSYPKKIYKYRMNIGHETIIDKTDDDMEYSLHIYPNFSIKEPLEQLFAYRLFMAMSPVALADIVTSCTLPNMKFLGWISEIDCRRNVFEMLNISSEKTCTHMFILDAIRVRNGEKYGHEIPIQERKRFAQNLRRMSRDELWEICFYPRPEHTRFLPKHVWLICVDLAVGNIAQWVEIHLGISKA
jgi:hypothetical protein